MVQFLLGKLKSKEVILLLSDKFRKTLVFFDHRGYHLVHFYRQLNFGFEHVTGTQHWKLQEHFFDVCIDDVLVRKEAIL